MILVIVGTQDMAFDRLIEQVITYAKNDIDREEIVIQAGCSQQLQAPDYVRYCDYVEHDTLQDLMHKARILVVHAGVGTIMEALKLDKPLIVVPRLHQYGEHHNDHQVEIAQSFASSGYVLYSENLSETMELAKHYQFEKYPFNSSNIVTYLHDIMNKE